MRLSDRLLRVALTAGHKLLRTQWFGRRRPTSGAHALPLTPERRLVLVKLRYASGWRVPGGGRNAGENVREAALRELREEIGLTGYGRARPARELADQIDVEHDLASLLVVEEVRYQPRRWSLEVEQVAEFELDALPRDINPTTRRWIDLLRHRI